MFVFNQNLFWSQITNIFTLPLPHIHDKKSKDYLFKILNNCFYEVFHKTTPEGS